MNKKELNKLKQDIMDAFINYQAYNYLYVTSNHVQDKYDLYNILEDADDMHLELPPCYDIDLEALYPEELDEFKKDLNGYLGSKSVHYSLKLKDLVKIE